MFEKRISKLRKFLENVRQAFLITDEKNVYYFSGVKKSEGKLFIFKSAAYLLVDFRYIEYAKNTCVSCEVIEFSSFSEEAKSLLKKHSADTVFAEDENLRISECNRFASAFDSVGVSLVTDSTLSRAISNLRIIKSQDEIEKISTAQKITEKSYLEILNYLKPGVSEREIAVELEYLMKKNGAEDISFDLITITGKKTSLPHGVPGEELIADGDFFTMDIGAIFDGYHSDMTRTVAVGSCSDFQREIYSIVLNAQLSALNAVKSGIKAYEVDRTARDIITNAGYGKCFGHATGHGVGLDIHEMPFVSTKGETILSEKMVITVEPGIYLENRFGVRIEDMILVKDNGFENFATMTKELIVV